MAQSSHQDQLQAAYAAQLEWQEEERTKHWDEFLLKTTPRYDTRHRLKLARTNATLFDNFCNILPQWTSDTKYHHMHVHRWKACLVTCKPRGHGILEVYDIIVLYSKAVGHVSCGHVAWMRDSL